MAELTPRPQPGARGPSSVHQVAREILRGLYEGRYAPGQRLLEPDLVRRCGVSRGSVREALQRLAAEGVVVLSPFRGAEIRRLTREEATGILRVVESLVGLAARIAAERVAAGADAAPVRRAAADLAALAGAPFGLELVRARNRFYRALIETGGNAELARLLPGLNVHLVRIRLRDRSAAGRAAMFGGWAAIAAAVASGRPEAAERAARRHVRAEAAMLAALPDADFAPPRPAPPPQGEPA